MTEKIFFPIRDLTLALNIKSIAFTPCYFALFLPELFFYPHPGKLYSFIMTISSILILKKKYIVHSVRRMFPLLYGIHQMIDWHIGENVAFAYGNLNAKYLHNVPQTYIYDGFIRAALHLHILCNKR